MSMTGERLPFPGLRSFTREETDLFFGREGCVDDMVDRLSEARFLAVLGASGSGKSSLVKTGLLDALEIGLLHRAGSRWVIADFRPGERPIQSMAEGLLKAVAADPNAAPDEEEVKFLRTFLARGPRSVVEWCEAGNLPEDSNLLLLVDQFEELFRYGAYAEREEAEAFVAQLLESARAPLSEARIYVVITMRSEYLGAAALIDGLAEAINKGLYLTPRMGRDQVRDAIGGPAAVCGFSIEPALVNRLLNDLTSFAPWEEGDTGHQLERLVRRADQLPLMQHVLNRLWSIAAARGGNGPIVLTLADYDRLGGLRGALAAHGREILDELLPEHQEIASAVFRALTAGSSLAEAVRRPTEFGELVEIAGGDEIAVREIIEAFRAPGRNFLVPARPTALRANTVIDISHESLIRQWDEFAQWLQREITSADTWRRLVDAAERYRRGEANLISGLTLASIANWWDTEHPTAAWAKRYGGDYASAAAFLDESRRAETAEKAREADERRQKSRNRFVTFAAIVILCIVTPLTIFAGYSAVRASREADRANVERANAEAERANAEVERKKAEELATLAQQETQRANDERANAEQQQQLAEEQQRLAEAAEADAKRLADEARRAALAEAQASNEARAQAAEARRQTELANVARRKFQLSNLQRFVDRLASLQQEGAWETAANYLGTLWQEISGPDPALLENWLIEPVVDAFRRQELAEYPVYPVFMSYSGLTGWTGTYGRFRVYDLDRKDADSAESANNVMGVFDAVTGAVTGTFELPNGLALGSELDIVAPDGRRAAIVTSDPNKEDQIDERQVALWSADRPAPTLLPMPILVGDVDLAELAPVQTDGRFGLYFTAAANPGQLSLADPAAAGITFSTTPADVASAAGLDSISVLKLLGVVDGRLIALVNSDADGRVVSVDTADGVVRELAAGGGVTGAALTPDGALLMTVTCPAPCDDQNLTAFDTRRDVPLWVERIPADYLLPDSGVQETRADGQPVYSVLVQNKGAGIIFQVPKSDPGQVVRLASESAPRMDEIAYDGEGGYSTVETVTSQASLDGVDAAGTLANFRLPIARQKLSYYVAPNSIAVFHDGDDVRLAGVTYDGDLLVYRLREDGSFEDDPNFRRVRVGVSNCVAAIGFGGDGNSVLIRHVDGYLRYVATIRNGPDVDWRDVTQSPPAPLFEPPKTDCEAPDTSTETIHERIVAADRAGRRFALLDKTGAVHWVEIVEPSAEQGGFSVGGAAMPVVRDIGAPTLATPPVSDECPEGQASGDARHCARAGSAMTWIAGDPVGGRAALVSVAAVDIVPFGMAMNGPREVRPEAASGPSGVRVEAAAAAGRPTEGPQKLTRRGEPKAATFASDGKLAVLYAEGQVVLFTEVDGIWQNFGEVGVPRGTVDTLLYSNGRIALADSRDSVLAIDAEAASIVGYGRAPASPSAYALRPDGRVLSIEYETDSISTLGLAPLSESARIDTTARLVLMRSSLKHESEASLDSLILDHRMEMSLASSSEAAPVDCAADERRYLSNLEESLFGNASSAVTQLSAECAEAANTVSMQAADTLAQRALTSSIRQLVEDGAFSSVLQAAAAGDAVSKRVLGAVLARIAIERGELDKSAIARDVIRFGTSIPAPILKAVAAGAPIEASLIEVAREHAGDDPGVHQLIAHWEERQINDIESLVEALFEFSIAERLYRAGGHESDAQYVGQRRAQLARVLPDKRVLDVLTRVEQWEPPPAAAPNTPLTLSDLPEDTLTRHQLDMENAERILADSPLLDGLRTELERARIFDLRGSDPKAAAAMLIELGKRTGGELAWSPDLVREYLALAEDMSGGDAADSAFQLATEAMKMIGIAFTSPIQANAEASELFRLAADLIAANVAVVPRDAALSTIAAIDLSLLGYGYGTLPAIGADAEVTAAEQVLESAARMAGAIAGVAENPSDWSWLEGESLFWQGVLVNDHDATAAAQIFAQSTAILRPLITAKGDDPAARYRLAEVLRWSGLAEPSNPATEAIERESVGLYRDLWSNRSALDPAFAGQVGAGFGFALANLAQTIREATLVDLNDGRTAEDHAGWFLDVLALAREQDDLNAALMETTAGDSGFVAGWYRMSVYGWAMGFLSGSVNTERGKEAVTQCDLLATDPYDPRRRAPGLLLGDVDVAKAETVCRAELVLHPEDSRTGYQLARVISADMARESEFMPVARIAADQGSSAALALIAYALGEKKDTRSADTYVAAAQRTVLESFSILFPFLESRAKAEREREALAWYARRAGALGIPEAQLALAKLAGDPLQKLFHTKLAARLFSEQGNELAATSARSIATAIFVAPADAESVDADVSAWVGESLIELPADVGAS